MMFTIISTAWCVFWLSLVIHAIATRGSPVSGALIVWFIIGWLPPIFYKMMAMKWGG